MRERVREWESGRVREGESGRIRVLGQKNIITSNLDTEC